MLCDDMGGSYRRPVGFPVVRIVLQRATRAHVEVDGRVVGSIDRGLVALVGITHADRPDDARALADKTASLRLFAHGELGFDRTVAEAGGGVLCVSQFTLYGDVRRGNRPSWREAARPDPARELIEVYVERLRSLGLSVSTGVFGADMTLSVDNDGPVTLVLDSAALGRPRREASGSPGPN
jgi:D-tyrosyl-tRNA(Tyr) deacylase